MESRGAELMLRRVEFNSLPRKSTVHVRTFLIANKLATAWNNVKATFATAFAVPSVVRATAA